MGVLDWGGEGRAGRPVLIVLGPSGADLVPRFGPALLGVTITDKAGRESDELTIRLAYRAPWDTPPPKGARYVVLAGWRGGSAPVQLGIYTVQRRRRVGDPESGEQIHIICRAADMTDKAKSAASRHYDAETGHGAAGKIFEDVAKELGVAAAIDPSIGGVSIPYRLRWRQSAMDFASDLADEIGATAKQQGGKLVVTSRAGGSSSSGETLPTVRISRAAVYSYEADVEPREEFEATSSPWFDQESGRAEAETFEGGGSSSVAAQLFQAPGKDEAQRQARATSDAHSRSTASGSFEIRGDATALAGAPVACEGFGADIDDVEWRAETVTHEFDPEGGWTTTVEAESKPSAREASKTS
ncbi:hypothetical protein [Methylopila sp. M107]|uniref:phage late control D family protein n=1 Tax=Methylopila sp. M107 TaxID=1101190 RepID=UPI00037BDAD3|nr:hypothetical protein [Methylopila sp. M107]